MTTAGGHVRRPQQAATTRTHRCLQSMQTVNASPASRCRMAINHCFPPLLLQDLARQGAAQPAWEHLVLASIHRISAAGGGQVAGGGSHAQSTKGTRVAMATTSWQQWQR